jgi:NTE family protein
VGAIVLSGGGARGAYEAGVLTALLERAGDRRVADVICGTSIGAVTGALLAAGVDAPAEVARGLERLWSSLVLEEALGFRLPQLAGLPALLAGGAAPHGVFDERPIARALAREVAWDRIGEHLAAGRLAAFTVTATHVATGRPTVFVQRRPDVPPPQRVGRRVVVRDAVIGPPHVLASGAIPVLFPPVLVEGELYCDGGLRLNTPLGPAIRLGATDVLAVAQSTRCEEPELPAVRYPSAAFLLGKVLNAFLLDHVMGDLDELFRINRFLADGVAVCGEDFVDRMAAIATAAGRPAYRPVRAHVIRPSVDLGVLAAEHLRSARRRFGRVSAARALLRLVDSREARGSDLASYLLFDREYTCALLALGRADALAAASELDAFLA